MLKVYICPKCGAVRYVSKFKTQCFKCNMNMVLSSVAYENYIELNTTERSLVIKEVISS